LRRERQGPAGLRRIHLLSPSGPRRLGPPGAERSLAGGREMARLTPITNKSQVAAKDQAIVDAIVKSRGAVQGPFTMFLHCPELAERVAHLGAFVPFEGPLAMRWRVLPRMASARELAPVYVWGARTGAARRLAGPGPTFPRSRGR